MPGSFSTDLVPASDRLEAWRWNAQQICGDCRFHFPERLGFHGSIEARRIAGLELTLFSSSEVWFQKLPTVSLRSDNRACIAITQLAGVQQYCQDGKVAILKRADTTLIDSGRPWSSDCQGDCARLYLRLPYFFTESRLQLSPVPIAQRISGASGLGAILFGLSTSLFRQADDLSSEEADAAVEAYLKILSACVGDLKEPLATGRGTDLLLSRIARYIENHLAETDLGPARIASAMGISVRHVHRVFAMKGSSVADWIREQRLRRCRRELADSQLREKSITEIAFSWGFNDSAHFSRSFKEQFGMCPRVFRTHAWANAAEANLFAGDHNPVPAAIRYLQPS